MGDVDGREEAIPKPLFMKRARSVRHVDQEDILEVSVDYIEGCFDIALIVEVSKELFEVVADFVELGGKCIERLVDDNVFLPVVQIVEYFLCSTLKFQELRDE